MAWGEEHNSAKKPGGRRTISGQIKKKKMKNKKPQKDGRHLPGPQNARKKRGVKEKEEKK